MANDSEPPAEARPPTPASAPSRWGWLTSRLPGRNRPTPTPPSSDIRSEEPVATVDYDAAFADIVKKTAEITDPLPIDEKANQPGRDSNFEPIKRAYFETQTGRKYALSVYEFYGTNSVYITNQQTDQVMENWQVSTNTYNSGSPYNEPTNGISHEISPNDPEDLALTEKVEWGHRPDPKIYNPDYKGTEYTPDQAKLAFARVNEVLAELSTGQRISEDEYYGASIKSPAPARLEEAIKARYAEEFPPVDNPDQRFNGLEDRLKAIAGSIFKALGEPAMDKYIDLRATASGKRYELRVRRFAHGFDFSIANYGSGKTYENWHLKTPTDSSNKAGQSLDYRRAASFPTLYPARAKLGLEGRYIPKIEGQENPSTPEEEAVAFKKFGVVVEDLAEIQLIESWKKPTPNTPVIKVPSIVTS